MVRPCSCPASKRSWQGAPKTRARHVREINPGIAVIGIDIGKNSFHVVGHDKRGPIMLRQKWSRGQVETRLANLPAACSAQAMRACGSVMRTDAGLDGFRDRKATPNRTFEGPPMLRNYLYFFSHHRGPQRAIAATTWHKIAEWVLQCANVLGMEFLTPSPTRNGSQS
jgi:hypothetical protein